MSIFENSNSLIEETEQYNSKECKNSKKKKQRYFEVYISKLLKNISPESSLTLNVKQQLNSCLTILAKEISDYAIKLTFFSGKKTLSEKEIDNAVKIIFSDDMYNSSSEYVNSKITKYRTDEGKYNSRQDKAGIIFPPSICERFLRNFGYSNIMVTEISPIYLASVIEFITETILVKAVERSQTRNKIRITIRDIDISIKTDSNLGKLFHTLNISFLGGGVIPYIHSSLLVKKPRKKKKIDNEIDKKNHRFRPGTVSIREVYYAMKKYNLHMITEVARQVLSERELHIDSLRHDLDLVDSYQADVFYRQIEAESKYDNFVSDRTIDNLAYAAQHSRILAQLIKSAEFKNYIIKLKSKDSVIFFVRPSKATLKVDGVRESLSWDGVVSIDGMVKLLLEMYELPYYQISVDNMQERVRLIDNVLMHID